MKNLFYFLALGATVLFTACGDDDEAPAPGLTGSITFDGTTTEITSGLLANFGTSDGVTNYDFYVSDGAINFGTDETSGTVLVYTELFSAGGSFSSGTFEYGNADAERSIGLATIETADGTSFATGGTVTVSGSDVTYEIEYNLEFSDDRTLTGTVNGVFTSQAISF